MPTWFVSGFSLVGLVVAILQQIPGIVRAIHPPRVDPFARNSGTPLVEVLEKTFGVATLVLLVVVFVKIPVLPSMSGAFLTGALVVLAAYYALYVAYYRGSTALPVLLGMAAFPPICFLLVALYQGNALALVTSVVFGTVHVGLTWSNFAPGDRAADTPA